MYLLMKLVLYRMTDEDVEKHLDVMAVIYEKSNALVTLTNPLTADNIFATALLISVPSTWLHSVSHLLNSPRTSSSQIVACLKAEANSHALTIDEMSPLKLVFKATLSYDKRRSNDPKSERSRLPCSPYDPDSCCNFCKATGHDLSLCKNAARVPSDHKHFMADELKKLRVGKPQSQRPEKVSKTKTISLGAFSDHDDDLGDEGASSESERDVRAARTCHSHTAKMAVVVTALKANHTNRWTVDSACSKLILPTGVNVLSLQADTPTIKLADDLIIKATHCGQVSLLISGHPVVSTLVVPNLEDPLLSVADVFDENLAVVFKSDGCKVYHSESVNALTPVLGEGYRRGNLYYLPRAVSPPSVCLAASISSDLSLLGYHRRLNHIGLKPLKMLLKLQNIQPTVMNEIEVQKCDVCVRGKLHCSPLKSRLIN